MNEARMLETITINAIANDVPAELAAVKKNLADVAVNYEAITRMFRAIAKTRTVAEAARAAVDEVRDAFGYAYGTYWEIDKHAKRMKFVLEAGSIPEEFRRATRESTFAEGEGIIGGCWKSRDLILIPDMGAASAVRAPVARRCGVKSGIATPLLADDLAVGVMDFYSLHTVTLTEDRVQCLRTVGALASATLIKLRNSDEIATVAQSLSSAAEELSAASQQMSANAEETSTQATIVAAAAAEVDKNLQIVGAGSQEMSASVHEISNNSHEAAKVATSAVSIAEQTGQIVSRLGDSSREIGDVVKAIKTIAQQTNLLALNATIEAARAGEAGRGFAVVANEVKELSKETAKATEDITRKIGNIQHDTTSVVSAIQHIGEVIKQVNDISNTIATALREQNNTTNEMSLNVSKASQGSLEITKNISGVAEAAQHTSHGANDTQQAASGLSQLALQLQALISHAHGD